MTQTDETVIAPEGFAQQIRQATWVDHGKAEKAALVSLDQVHGYSPSFHETTMSLCAGVSGEGSWARGSFDLSREIMARASLPCAIP